MIMWGGVGVVVDNKTGYEPGGRRFESVRARHILSAISIVTTNFR